MKYRDLLKKFFEERIDTLKTAILETVQSIEDATDQLPQEEIMKSFLYNPSESFILGAKIDEKSIIFSTDCISGSDPSFDRDYICTFNNEALNRLLEIIKTQYFINCKIKVSALLCKEETELDLNFDYSDCDEDLENNFKELVNTITTSFSDVYTEEDDLYHICIPVKPNNE